MIDREPRPDDVVIIGQAARMPGVTSLESWWHGLCAGTEFHHVSTDDELRAAGVPDWLLEDPQFVRRRPIISDAEYFDPQLFGFTPREAANCDPQQRLFLEVCWELFEQSGHDPRHCGATCGVFAGAGPTTYATAINAHHDPAAHFDAVVANERDFIAPRVAYKLGLQGPAISIVSGCATSLVAIHLAVQSLQNYETDIAAAGGATIFFPQHSGYRYNPHGITSPDGRCRPFSASASGTVHGDGVGAVLLRRREDAEADNDTILGVILGTAVTNDGSDKMGFTAPSLEGEVRAISEALAVADVPAATINYIETHGTATTIGDAIEIRALNQALSDAPKGACLLGALKPNIGHTDTAAGVTGLIKVLHAFEHEQLPPVAGFDAANPSLELDGPCRVNTAVTPWPRGNHPRRAGVSSFSIGGTNAHIIVEEPPPPISSVVEEPREMIRLRFSAHTDKALSDTISRFADWVETRTRDGQALPSRSEMAFTLAERISLPRRRVIPIASHDDLVASCRTAIAGVGTDGSSRPTVFMFSGQGSQYPRMARDLTATSDVFADTINRCQLVFDRYHIDIAGLITDDTRDDECRALLNQTQLTQPALFAMEIGLAHVLQEWGIRPDAVVGHSVGEFAAAVVAGCLTLEEAADAVALRGQLVANTSVGAMAAVSAPVALVEKILTESSLSLDIAAVNNSQQTVISGAVEDIERACQEFSDNSVRARRLMSERAFHSRFLDPILDSFTKHMSTYSWQTPTIPMVWASDGSWLETAPTEHMWAQQLRRTVRFDQAFATCHSRFPAARWVEVGPGRVLADIVSFNDPQLPVAPLITAEWDSSLEALCDRVWAHGLSTTHLTPAAQRVRMPGVAMQRELLSIRTATNSTTPTSAGSATPTTVQPPTPVSGSPAEVVQQVWAEEFGFDAVSDTADFFADGGDSVVAARIAARIAQSFPVALGPGHVMQEPPTPAALTDRLTALLTEHIASLSDDEVTALLQSP